MNHPGLPNNQVPRHRSDSPQSKVETKWHCQLRRGQNFGLVLSVERFTYRCRGRADAAGYTLACCLHRPRNRHVPDDLFRIPRHEPYQPEAVVVREAEVDRPKYVEYPSSAEPGINPIQGWFVLTVSDLHNSAPSPAASYQRHHKKIAIPGTAVRAEIGPV